MPNHEAKLVGWLQAALEEKYGVALEFLTDNDARLVRQKLYPVQKQHPEYLNLGFLVKGRFLWIVKKQEETVSDPLASD